MTDTERVALLPCPFCGGHAAHLMTPKNSKLVAVGCMQTGCPASQAYACGDNYEEAGRHWNTRLSTIPNVDELKNVIDQSLRSWSRLDHTPTWIAAERAARAVLAALNERKAP